MAAPRKLTASQTAEIRSLRSEGVPVVELARRFGVSRQRVYELTATAPPVTADGSPGPVTLCVQRMAEAGRFDPADAALALALARAVDRADAGGDTVVLPRLVHELRELLSVAARDEPDEIDALIESRRRRLEGLDG